MHPGRAFKDTGKNRELSTRRTVGPVTERPFSSHRIPVTISPRTSVPANRKRKTGFCNTLYAEPAPPGPVTRTDKQGTSTVTKNRWRRQGTRTGSGTSVKQGEDTGPQHIRKILQSVLRETGLEEQVHENRALFCWDEVAGPALAAHTRASFVERGTLWVEVDNPVRIHSLQMQETDLRNRVNHALKESGTRTESIRQIRFRLTENR